MGKHLFNCFILFVTSIYTSYCWPSGAPESTCVSMAPNLRSHGSLPKSNSRNVDKWGFGGPVQLDLVFFDRSKNITIFAKDDSVFQNDKFKGFMLQIHYDADRYDSNFSKKGPIGKFTVSRNSPYKCMDCNGKCDSITHKNNEPKTEITVTWTKPDDYSSENGQDLYLKYTIVTEKRKYWVGLEFPPREEDIPNFDALGFRIDS